VTAALGLEDGQAQVREAVLACSNLWRPFLGEPDPQTDDDRSYLDRVVLLLGLFSWGLSKGVVTAPEVMERWLACLAQIATVCERCVWVVGCACVRACYGVQLIVCVCVRVYTDTINCVGGCT
jgi:hypothetical protein